MLNIQSILVYWLGSFYWMCTFYTAYYRGREKSRGDREGDINSYNSLWMYVIKGLNIAYMSR